MPFVRVHNIRLDLDDDPSLLTGLAAERIGIVVDDVQELRIARKSLDARKRGRIKWVYSVDLLLENPPSDSDRFSLVDDRDPLDEVEPGQATLPGRPVIIGCGPAGIFAAYTLTRFGYSPLVIERGAAVRERVSDVRKFWKGGAHNDESNLLFGEGGAGTFSDGKLTCRTSNPLISYILKVMVEHRGPAEILYESRPHIGTDRLRAVLVTMRKHMEESGAEFQFNTRMDDLVVRDGEVKGIQICGIGAPRQVSSLGAPRQVGEEFLPSGPLLLGIGHSARDTYEMLLSRGVEMEFKPFQFGLRVEHPQELVDRSQYGQSFGHPALGASEYILVRDKGKKKRAVFSFCMCPGGIMLPAISESGMLCTNGMSNHKRDSGRANSGFVTTIGDHEIKGDDPLKGIRLQQEYEGIAFSVSGSNYTAPAQSIPDFIRGTCRGRSFDSTYPRGLIEADLSKVMPAAVGRAMVSAFKEFDRKLEGFTSDAGIVTGPESRGSSPVRICRNEETRESQTVSGLYPIGEGAGYAGGIISAALDGMASALAIIRRYAAPK
ncbi:MAG: FAD-dependent oxidoreductase [Planctomycetota bacterium]|jgi:hypothetical protein|nr:FAD-dependent oxidoreductase [Planctomycetota bacterium]MDP7251349.1 FAD-dependent oxidoreductase [Planctomycetota bacterium]